MQGEIFFASDTSAIHFALPMHIPTRPCDNVKAFKVRKKYICLKT